jgi:hypothetical protein
MDDYMKNDLVIRISTDGIARVFLGEEPIGVLQRVQITASDAHLPRLVLHGCAYPGSSLPARFVRLRELFPYGEFLCEELALPSGEEHGTT